MFSHVSLGVLLPEAMNVFTLLIPHGIVSDFGISMYSLTISRGDARAASMNFDVGCWSADSLLPTSPKTVTHEVGGHLADSKALIGDTGI